MKEPIVSVGIMSAPEVKWHDNADGTFTLEDVTIGVNFHWQRKQQQTFHGTLSVIEHEGQQLAINEVPVEQYLESVITSEMSAEAPLEYLKMHAVVSRSWLFRQLRAYRTDVQADKERPKDIVREDGTREVNKWYDSDAHTVFDVCADDHCQRYQGIPAVKNPQVHQAIVETRGEVLVSDEDDSICDARFSKCCGGKTERYSACWDNRDVSYLQTVDDPYCALPDERLLRMVLNDYDRETLDFHDWEVRYTTQELSELLARKSGVDFGEVLSLEPLERGDSGRIVRLKIVGTKQTCIVGKELEIRRWLSESHLYSSWFDVEKTSEGFLLRGHGWGHGAGMCQIGAAEMCRQGFDYQQILEHYYKRTHLKKLYE